MVTMPEDVVNDCLVELGREITPEIIAKIVQMLPSDITHLAEEWGWNDTEVGDKVYTFIKSH
ncbi:TPA: hypothetical protein MYN16_004145 [Klebsiella pneumoniae]|uniref:hypothetical protein n=1 Tax=Klebsiella pneumoniae TaxID=573 RepID=UPI001B30298D|nr:hypothetical protein [Klebsiella pneumoniae]HDS9266083.1 hypothetical protein [Klebsiella pneumoniae subsp. pneumoniae]MBP3167167.1 hypothetical protein [Klebsiella pneumoniae]MBP3172463.1 hypothetical protein [Klebsiella pneumoniae]MBP3183605.1 hypothetical protein [Klebsiella pneumoniae]HBT3679561.1 hypothetical protein [Klebsiella pneumoniae]